MNLRFKDCTYFFEVIRYDYEEINGQKRIKIKYNTLR